MRFKKFDKKDRSTFTYWFYHMLAYNTVAWRCGHWRPWYIFHDIEKPFLLLLWKDYNRVQLWHREHNRHHLEYGIHHGLYNIDYIGMMIDWECSHLTKNACKLNARGELDRILEKNQQCFFPSQKDIIRKESINALEKLGL